MQYEHYHHQDATDYGHFCDIEVVDAPVYFVFPKRDSFEIKRLNNPALVPLNALPHPVYSSTHCSDSWCIDVKEGQRRGHNSDDRSTRVYTKIGRLKESFKQKLKTCLKISKGTSIKQYFYSTIVCSMFAMSVYIAIIMPL
jgi:hypothetical protein